MNEWPNNQAIWTIDNLEFKSTNEFLYDRNNDLKSKIKFIQLKLFSECFTKIRKTILVEVPHFFFNPFLTKMRGRRTNPNL